MTVSRAFQTLACRDGLSVDGGATTAAHNAVVVHHYAFDAPRQLMRVRLSGVLAIEALWTLLRDLDGDPRLTSASCAIIDLRDVRSVGEIHHDDIRTLAKTRIAALSRCALVAHEPAVFGLCRMWAAFRDLADESQAVEVFRSVLAAEAWLDEPPGDQ